ncbi:MAG: Polyvinylalcohol dehydrogenase [Pseudomonadota bacterium]
MHKNTRYLAALLAAVAMNTQAVPAASSKPDGQKVYQTHCAGCHEKGIARAPTPETMRGMTPESVVRALETGVMRVVGTFSLNGPERAAVAEYVTGKPLSANWSAQVVNQCPASNWPTTAQPLAQPHWNGWGVNARNTRFQPDGMAHLPKDKVSNLELQWAFAFPGETLAEAHASVIDGRLFVGSRSGQVYALDAKTGCTHWVFQAKAAVKGPVLVGQVADGRWLAFLGDVGGRAYAVDAATGKEVWQLVTDEHPSARLTGGFQLHEGKLYIPVSSLEEGLAADPAYQCCTFRGAVLRVEAATGKVEWKQYTVSEPPHKETSSVTGKTHYGPNGAAIWAALTLDPENNRIYASTGDNYTQPATDTSDAILALSMDKGEVLWAYQGLPGDAWNASCTLENKANCPNNDGPDHDMGSSPILVNLASGKRLLLGGQKTGVMHAIDPDKKGAVVWKTRVGEGGIIGGIEWGSAADDKAVYVAVSDAKWEGGRFFGDKVTLDASAGGGLYALDLMTGKPLWNAPPVSCAGRERCSPAQSAAVTAIPGVVFSGSMSGVMRAFDTANGEVLWTFDTVREYESVNGAAARGGAIDQAGVVVVDGWVYVNSGYANWGGLPGNVLLAFKPRE